MKVLNEYAYRVQKSVFEGIMSKSDIEECSKKLKKVIDETEDSVRFYPLCKDCEAKVAIMGVGTTVEETSYIIL